MVIPAEGLPCHAIHDLDIDEGLRASRVTCHKSRQSYENEAYHAPHLGFLSKSVSMLPAERAAYDSLGSRKRSLGS